MLKNVFPGNDGSKGSKKSKEHGEQPINDFMARFLSGSLEKEGQKLSPIEIELLYLFHNSKKGLTEKQIFDKNPNISNIPKLLKNMEKKNLIRKGSPYRLGEKGRDVIRTCIQKQEKVEPIIKNNNYYNILYQASATSVKM